MISALHWRYLVQQWFPTFFGYCTTNWILLSLECPWSTSSCIIPVGLRSHETSQVPPVDRSTTPGALVPLVWNHFCTIIIKAICLWDSEEATRRVQYVREDQQGQASHHYHGHPEERADTGDIMMMVGLWGVYGWTHLHHCDLICRLKMPKVGFTRLPLGRFNIIIILTVIDFALQPDWEGLYRVATLTKEKVPNFRLGLSGRQVYRIWLGLVRIDWDWGHKWSKLYGISFRAILNFGVLLACIVQEYIV